MAGVFGNIGKPYWDDRPVAVIGSGPSIIGFDLEQLRGAHVLAVKHAIFSAPWADAGFGMDLPRLEEWHSKLSNVQNHVYWGLPEDQLVPLPPSRKVIFLRRRFGLGVPDSTDVVYGGRTSDFAAFQVCLHKRAKEIVLFGFDYVGEPFQRWAEHFRIFVPYLNGKGISVINACPNSSLSCFQRATLQDGVAALRIKHR